MRLFGETEAVKLIAQIVCELRTAYPEIHYHLYSGNAEDVTERLDKGLLDFGLLIQPADISKYDYFNIPARDTWGVIMRKDIPLAKKETIRKEDQKRRSAERSLDLLTSGHFRRAAQE